ncbi:hypothetical protein D9611_000178 [Ephemerocybe angulata]|uniref:Uncharacterized protein n=1 Tax=Ephemerocybe angulata TaxID=980116 RepID=A0A8H5BMR3_9AGAR|nr:hypothetical protein D9611_000178 [Tulosesus angulatus]
MRAAISLYETPELTSSEVWGEGSYAVSRLCSVLGALSIAAVASSVAVYQYSSAAASTLSSSLGPGALLRSL